MKLHKGINRDASPSELTEGHWVRAKNKMMSRMLDSVNDEYGFAPFGEYPEELKPIGHIELANGDTVVFSIPSEIGILKADGTYIRKIADSLLGFDENFPITGDYHYGFNNRLIVAYRAANMRPAILNLDKLPFEVSTEGGLIDSDKMNLINLFPDAEIPLINLNSVNDSGGSLLSGVYYVAVAYEVDKEDATNYVRISNPITVVKDSSTLAENKFHGIEAGESTSKSITVSLLYLDTRFKYVKIALVSKINGLVSAKEIKRLSITGNTITFQITGSETSTAITNEEILIKRIDYNRIHTITNLDGTLYAANVSTEADLDFQEVANNIKLEWLYEDVIQLDKIEGSYKDPETIYTKRMFMPDEVYAFYAKVILANGADGGAYHIPGRAVRAISSFPTFNENATFQSIIDAQPNTLTGIANKASLAEEALLNPNARFFQTRDTSAADGTMSYWENENEFYPDTVRTDGTRLFPEGKVRHHKFPSIRRLSTVYGKPYLAGAEGSVTTRALGLKVSNIVVPVELQDKIQAIEIHYAKRTVDNSTIYGYTEGLFNEWDFGSENVGTDENPRYWLRTHSFDMLLDKPGVTPDYIREELKVGVPVDWNNVVDKYLGWANWRYWGYKRTKHTYNYANASLGIRRIVESRYLPNNVSGLGGELENRYREEAFMLKFSGDTRNLDQSLISIKGYKQNLYISFLEQDLVATNVLIKDFLSPGFIYGGDTFVSPYGVRASRYRAGANDSSSNPHLYKEVYTKYYIPTVNNIGLRNSGEEWHQKYYPYDLRSAPYIYGESINQSSIASRYLEEPLKLVFEFSNYIDYTKDYTSVGDLNKTFPYTGEEEESERPFLIMRSKRTLAEDKSQAWRVFLPNDYYESVKNRGPIENLQAYGSMLIIHHRYDLLRTIEKTTIETSEGTATLGSGDLFRMKPEPIVPTRDGYAGTQNQLSCVLTKVGYLFADAENGKIFLLSNELNEISNRGLYEFFRTRLPFALPDDNPYFGTGIITTYDEENNRILITKKELDSTSFTASYSIDGKFWVCDEHDYLPDTYLSNQKRFASFKNGKLYRHNDKNSVCKYYDEAIFPSGIDLVFPIGTEAVLHSLSWEANAVSPNGQVNHEETFDSIIVYTNAQCSGEVSLKRYKGMRDVLGVWRFNDFIDMVRNRNTPFMEDGVLLPSNLKTKAAWFNKSLFIDKFFIVRLIHNNLSQNNLYIYKADASVSKSVR